MKKVMYILSCIALFLSCGDKDVYKAPEVDLNLLKPYEDMEVIVPEGYASIVKLYDDTLAICTYSTTISVPTYWRLNWVGHLKIVRSRLKISKMRIIIIKAC